MQDYIKRLATTCAASCDCTCYYSAASFAFHLHFITASFHQHLQHSLLHSSPIVFGEALPSFHFAATCAAFFPFAASCAALTPQLQHVAFYR
ncbi:hypothetical protein SLEP1_g44930 [Rubroshorea leprosula]|uniref:Uncharacterized protein n=1 Tax=Rubroshorea leprosula TaxID=152421 RepID=A0AAV5LI90_9ROSI|nr:hypothetical protein SLEP1_g44930 [Rubroshorea leprosula]